VLLALLLCARSGAAWGADDNGGDPAVEEARKHYRRGVEFYNDQSYAAALAEFRRAYEIAPNVNVLYNIGQLQFRLQDYAGALSTLLKYLSDGGSTVAPDRRSAVERDIERLRDRVAYVEVRTSVDGADVLVGDAVVGRTPLSEPVLTNIGRVHFSLRQAGREVATRDVDLAAGDHLQIELEPAAPLPAPSPAPAPVPGPAPAPTLPAASAAPPPSVGPLAPLGETGGHPRSSRWVTTATWAGAAALATGATITGVLALSSAGDLAQQRRTDGVTRDALDATQSRVKGLALATDLLGAAALISSGVAVYLTLDSRAHARSVPITLRVSPRGVSASCAF
jgi:hypothetical protein